MGVKVVARMGPLTDSEHLREERGKRSTMVDDKEGDKKSRKALVACSWPVSEFENGARRYVTCRHTTGGNASDGDGVIA